MSYDTWLGRKGECDSLYFGYWIHHICHELALLSLYELIRKRMDTDVAFTMEITRDIKSKEQ
jgi:hypothetical protein